MEPHCFLLPLFCQGWRRMPSAAPFKRKPLPPPIGEATDPFLSLPIGIWQQKPFSSPYHALQNGHCVEKEMSISRMGNLSRDHFWAFRFGYCFWGVSLFLGSSRGYFRAVAQHPNTHEGMENPKTGPASSLWNLKEVLMSSLLLVQLESQVPPSLAHPLCHPGVAKACRCAKLILSGCTGMESPEDTTADVGAIRAQIRDGWCLS